MCKNKEQPDLAIKIKLLNIKVMQNVYYMQIMKIFKMYLNFFFQPSKIKKKVNRKTAYKGE